MLEYGSSERWPAKYCARKWEELHPGAISYNGLNFLVNPWESEHCSPIESMDHSPRPLYGKSPRLSPGPRPSVSPRPSYTHSPRPSLDLRPSIELWASRLPPYQAQLWFRFLFPINSGHIPWHSGEIMMHLRLAFYPCSFFILLHFSGAFGEHRPRWGLLPRAFWNL